MPLFYRSTLCVCYDKVPETQTREREEREDIRGDEQKNARATVRRAAGGRAAAAKQGGRRRPRAFFYALAEPAGGTASPRALVVFHNEVPGAAQWGAAS
jgi:hypothetical protein